MSELKREVQRITVKGIIELDGNVLFVQDHKNKLWELPGGKANFSEQPQDALKRELREELGITDVYINRLINVWSFVSELKEASYQFVVIVYACETTTQAIKKISLSDEHDKHVWLDADSIINYPMRDGYKESLKKYYQK